MKKIIILIMCLCFAISPVCLNAEIKSENLEEALKSENIEPKFSKYKEEKESVPIYFFRGQGDSKSRDFLNFLNDNYEEYGKFFRLVSYEVYYNNDNRELMENTKEYIHASVNSVPFMVIGDVHFITYDKSVNENLINTFLALYQSEKKVDKVSEVLVKYYRNYDLIIGIIIGIIVLIIVGIVYATIKGKNKK